MHTSKNVSPASHSAGRHSPGAAGIPMAPAPRPSPHLTRALARLRELRQTSPQVARALPLRKWERSIEAGMSRGR